MKRSDELRQEIQSLKAEAEKLTKAEEIKAKIGEVKDLQAQLEVAIMTEEEETLEIQSQMNSRKAKLINNTCNEVENSQELELRAFAKAMSGRVMKDENEIKALSSLTDKDGKLLIPSDVRTAINTWLRQYQDIGKYASVETVSMIAGSRVYEVEADVVPFENVAELTNIPSVGSPEFQKIDYTCQYYKGLLEIPNELLKNETGGLMAYISQWIAKKMVATRNTLAFYANGTKADGLLGITTGGLTIDKSLTSPISFKQIDTALNVTLPMTISASSECRIYTCQSLFNYLLSVEDKQGRRYLQEDLTKPGVYRYAGKEIVVFDDRQLKSEKIANKDQYPMIVGNLKEALKIYELENFAVESDRSAGFKNDSTVMRIIGATTTKLIDKKAAIAIYSPLP